MLRTTQRRMLRLIIQTRRKYKNNKNLDKDIRNDEISEDTEEKTAHMTNTTKTVFHSMMIKTAQQAKKTI